MTTAQNCWYVRGQEDCDSSGCSDYLLGETLAICVVGVCLLNVKWGIRLYVCFLAFFFVTRQDLVECFSRVVTH